jgi:hypothetical protein
MLSLKRLATLRENFADTRILTVYVDAEEHDPSLRNAWRTRLQTNLATLAEDLPTGERDAFEQARRRLMLHLRSRKGALPGRGWVGFVTPAAVQLWEELPAAMPDLARWGTGPVLTPWLRALKQERAVLVALVDSRRARLLRYRHGVITQESDTRADTHAEDLTDRNMSKRPARSSGVRGETATDAADRLLRQETARLVDAIAASILGADADAFIVIGGSAAATAMLQRQLPADERIHVEPGLQVGMSLPQVKEVIEPLASRLTQRRQRELVHSITELAGAGNRGAVGAIGTAHAAERGQVDLLLLTPSFMRADEQRAEEIVAHVLSNGGEVDVAGGEVADELDAAGGIAARLRYVRRAAGGPATQPA